MGKGRRWQERRNEREEGLTCYWWQAADKIEHRASWGPEIGEYEINSPPGGVFYERTGKMYPIQDGEDIPEWLAKLVYQGYVNTYGDQQSYERMRERGGFDKAEVIWLLNCLNIKTIEDAGRALKNSK